MKNLISREEIIAEYERRRKSSEEYFLSEASTIQKYVSNLKVPITFE